MLDMAFIKSRMRPYCDDMVFFHKTWLVSREETKHG